MARRLDRRVTLALWLALFASPTLERANQAADSAPFASELDSAVFTTPVRPAPFYEERELDSTTKPWQARAQRVAPLKTKRPAATISEAIEPPAPPEILGELDTTAIPKTPLPSVEETDSAESAPAARGRSGFGSSMIWTIGLLAVGWIARQVLKNGGPLALSGPNPIEVLTRQSIGPQQQIALVRFGQRLLLVGTTPTGMSTLSTVEDPVEVQAIVDELRPVLTSPGPTMMDLFRSRRPKVSSEPAPRNVSLTTEGRSKFTERRTVSETNREVTDV